MKYVFKQLVIIILSNIIILILSSNIVAQDNFQDVVYLKNGSVLHGKITEIKANESITLLSNCNDIWVINQSDIEKIGKEEIPKSLLIQNQDNRIIEYKTNGFYSNINVGFLFGGNMDTPFPPTSLMFVNGYQFDVGFAVGAGLGLDLLNEAYMPAVVDLRYTFKNSKVSHFIYVQAGYAISLESPDPYNYDFYSYYESDSESKGGFLINPGIGIKLNINEKNAFSFGIAYKYMEINHTYIE